MPANTKTTFCSTIGKSKPPLQTAEVNNTAPNEALRKIERKKSVSAEPLRRDSTSSSVERSSDSRSCDCLGGQEGGLLWVGVCLQHGFGRQFSMVSMVSINLRIWFYGVEKGDAGESIEPEESH
jgi:hypothetical protein